MPKINPLKILGTIDALLPPIQKVIAAVLPNFLEKNLTDPAVREQMVKAADQLLVKQYPQAKLVPKATRQKIIRKMLDMVIDDLLLPEEL